MKKHFQIVHDGRKDHKCTVCPKCFAEEKRLNDHMNIHTGNKPYECKYCHCGFADNGNMKTHKKTAHQGYKSKKMGLRKVDAE